MAYFRTGTNDFSSIKYTNLEAGNIKNGVTVTVKDPNDITLKSVTGTFKRQVVIVAEGGVVNNVGWFCKCFKDGVLVSNNNDYVNLYMADETAVCIAKKPCKYINWKWNDDPRNYAFSSASANQRILAPGQYPGSGSATAGVIAIFEE